VTAQAEKLEQLAENRRHATDAAVREKEEAITARLQETAELRAALEAATATADELREQLTAESAQHATARNDLEAARQALNDELAAQQAETGRIQDEADRLRAENEVAHAGWAEEVCDGKTRLRHEESMDADESLLAACGRVSLDGASEGRTRGGQYRNRAFAHGAAGDRAKSCRFCCGG